MAAVAAASLVLCHGPLTAPPHRVSPPPWPGYDVTLCSAKGGEIPLDEGSKGEPNLTAEGTKFLNDGEWA